MNKLVAITTCVVLLTGLSLTLSPKPAEAFTIFGVRFFEKPTPTPSPTPSATPTPTPTPTPKVTPTPTATATATPTVLGDQTSSLPHTGPAEDVSIIILGITSGFIARKFWLVNHS